VRFRCSRCEDPYPLIRSRSEVAAKTYDFPLSTTPETLRSNAIPRGGSQLFGGETLGRLKNSGNLAMNSEELRVTQPPMKQLGDMLLVYQTLPQPPEMLVSKNTVA
jgi:hypothetical protein